MSDEPCRRCSRNLHFRAWVDDAMPYSICAVCVSILQEKSDAAKESTEEAMAAGYAQGVEAAEARATKRISELEAAVSASRRVVNAATKISLIMGTKECPVHPKQDEAFVELEMALVDLAASTCSHAPTKEVGRFEDAWMGSTRSGSYEGGRTYSPIVCRHCGASIRANRELTKWDAVDAEAGP